MWRKAILRRFIFSIAILCSGGLVWTLLAFLIHLPIDESKVYPSLLAEVRPPEMLVVDMAPDGQLILTRVIEKDTLVVPKFDESARVMMRLTPQGETEIPLADHPHTRRYVTRLIEEKHAFRIWYFYEVGALEFTRDPFARTRLTIIAWLQQARTFTSKLIR